MATTAELAPRPQSELEPVEQTPGDLLRAIMRAAADPNVDPEKVRAYLDMARTLQKDQAQRDFWSAMAIVQSKMPRVSKSGEILSKDGQSVRSRYAKYEDIDAALRPLLAQEGLSVFYQTDYLNKVLKVEAKVTHRNGHSETTTVHIPLDENQYRGAAQNMGSTVSYGKRYALCAAFNIITVDDDDDAQGRVPLDDEDLNKIEDWLQNLGDTPQIRNAFSAYLKKTFGVTTAPELCKGDLEDVLHALKQKAQHGK